MIPPPITVPPISRGAWAAALLGLALAVFALVALAGPGRIDVVDGQTRFEVGRSLVEHGDSVIRDPRVTWGVFPGRDGHSYTYYRFPQSALAAGAVLLADATGVPTEGRRHFVFALTGALACAVLAVAYAVWFRAQGRSPLAAVGWALAGVVCTPNFFYGTSTYDDILGAAVAVAAVAVGARDGWRCGLLAGLLAGLAYNCKQPLGVFALPALAVQFARPGGRRARLAGAAVVALGLALGVAVEQGYDRWKYPPGTKEGHAELLTQYLPVWPGDLPAGVADQLFSPGAGVVWHCPPLVLALVGLGPWWRRQRAFTGGTLAACAVVLLFYSSMSFFKGDPSWGPRYLTPACAVLWLFAPAGAALVSRFAAGLLLALGLAVQLLGLSVDPHRFFVERGLPAVYGAVQPWLYFNPRYAPLAARPGEVAEVAADRGRAERFTPAPSPTFAFPLVDARHFAETGPEAVARYQVLRSWRPWWLSQRWLDPADRPVALAPTAALLGGLAALGLALLTAGLRVAHPPVAAAASGGKPETTSGPSHGGTEGGLP